MFYIEDLIVIVRWLALAVALIDVFLVAYILVRRMVRSHYHLQKDAASRQFSAIVCQFSKGTLDLSNAAPALRNVRTPAQTTAVQELLLAAITEKNRENISNLLQVLGYIRTWANQAFGKRRAQELIDEITSGKSHVPAGSRKFRRIRRLRVFAVRRALPVAHFGKLAPKYAEVLLGEALQDPSPYVTRPAVSALGKTLSPLAVPILLEQLRQASAGQSEIPVRSAKAALVRHSTDRLEDFLRFLESPEDRFRLLVVETIREMLTANPSLANTDNFPRDLYHWFTHQARFDISADVRARSAAIIGHFHDANSIETLRAMLRDENEYVRLHAARACADPFYSELVDNLVECMTDRRWRVRESAAKSLAAVGTPGAQALAGFFLATNDRYASEQIADELQRSGLLLQLVPMLGSSDLEADKAAAVCGKMASLGMTSLFKWLLQHETEITVRNELLKILASCPECPLTADSQATPVKADHLSMNNAAPFLGMTDTQTTIAAGK